MPTPVWSAIWRHSLNERRAEEPYGGGRGWFGSRWHGACDRRSCPGLSGPPRSGQGETPEGGDVLQLLGQTFRDCFISMWPPVPLR